MLVISNNSSSGALARAHHHGIKALHVSGRTHPAAGAEDQAIVQALEVVEPDLVVLAGYMKRLGTPTLRAFAGRIINTHPALLPKHGGQGFYGDRVHQAVLDAGDTESGATVHLVDGEYDRGSVLQQAIVPVLPDDDLSALRARVQAAERKLLIDTLAQQLTARP